MASKEWDDDCRYLRPFLDGFHDCLAYQPVRFVPLDTMYRELKPVWGCGHLEARFASQGRAYARCRIGNLEARVAWAREVGAQQLEEWRTIAAEFGRALEPDLRDIYELKRRQLEASEPESAAAADAALSAAIRSFREHHDELMAHHGERLAEIGFPNEAVRILTREALKALYERDTLTGSWQPPAALLEAFPPAMRTFLAGLFGPAGGDA